MRHWLMQLWRLRSPMICCPEKLVVQFCLSMRPDNQGSWWYKSKSKSRRRWNEISQWKQWGGGWDWVGEGWVGEGINHFLPSFVFKPSTEWMMSILIGEGNLFHSVYQLKCIWTHPPRPTHKHSLTWYL